MIKPIDRSKNVFTTGEVAALIGVVPATVAKWQGSGLLKGHRLPTPGAPRRFLREDLIAFLREHGVAVAGLYPDPAEETAA